MIESDTEIPERFALLLAGEHGRQRRCRVVWQEGKHFGAIFIKAPVAKDEDSSKPRFREMMRRA